MRALPPYIIEPVWAQFEALLPEHETDHPLGCHRRRISDRVVFEKLVQALLKTVRELIEARGCELIYPPPYSPDLNPIEEAFSKVDHLLRKIGARGKKSLVEAMGRALEAVSIEDARGFFAHRGYRTPAQQQ